MPGRPWNSFGQGDPDREILVVATHLVLDRFSSTLDFTRLVRAIRTQLASTPRLLGDSMLGSRSRSSPGRSRSGRARTSWTRSWAEAPTGRSWPISLRARTVPGSEDRPRWDEALARLR